MKTKEQKTTLRQKKLMMRKIIVSNSFRVALLSVIAVFGFLNVIQITKISTTGYEMSDLEKEITILKQENKQIDFKISTYRSMQHIQNRLGDMNMVRADKVEYITVPGNAVAVR